MARLPIRGVSLARDGENLALRQGQVRDYVPFVDVMTRETPGGRRAHFHGVFRCANWYGCATCSPQLRMERGGEVTQAAEWWRGQGGAVELMTLTFAHAATDNPRDLIKKRSRCWRKLFAGAPGKRLRAKLGLTHYIRGSDETHGRNGLHPHFHVVCFVSDRSHAERRLNALRSRWHDVVRDVLGRAHLPAWSRGADLRQSKKHDYLAKLGLELTSPQSKTAKHGGRTLWAIARSAADGNEDDAQLWQRLCRGMKGAHQLSWSRKLKKAAGIVSRTDEEIVEGEDGEETHVASIPGREWQVVADIPGATYAIKRGAETDGRIGVARALAMLYRSTLDARSGAGPPSEAAFADRDDQLTLDLFLQIAPRVESSLEAAA